MFYSTGAGFLNHQWYDYRWSLQFCLFFVVVVVVTPPENYQHVPSKSMIGSDVSPIEVVL